MTLAHGLGFAGAVLVIMVSEQAILNSGVLIVKVETGDDALAALIFAVLMIARAPLQLFQAVSTTLLPHLTRLLVREGEGHGGEFGRSVRLTVAACLAFGGVDGARGAGGRPARDAAAVRPGVRLRPARARDGRRRHGPVPVRDHREPSGAGAGPRAARRGILGHRGRVLRRVPPDRGHGGRPRGRGRVPGHRGPAVGAAVSGLPAPAGTRSGASSPVRREEMESDPGGARTRAAREAGLRLAASCRVALQHQGRKLQRSYVGAARLGSYARLRSRSAAASAIAR